GGFSQAMHGPRTEEDLQSLQQEWVTRYTERVRAHRLLGVSMGTPLEDVEESHRLLVAHLLPGDPRRWKLDQALQLVQATAEAGATERHDGGALARAGGDEASEPAASADA